jgi:hypothetical protein
MGEPSPQKNHAARQHLSQLGMRWNGIRSPLENRILGFPGEMDHK